jgi:predicted nucleic acid-binding protein
MRSLLLLSVLLTLVGCAASNARLLQVRELAGDAPKLAAFAELSARYRDTYKRELPYLSPDADQRERVIDAKRHEAYPDFVALHDAVTAYLHALGALAGKGQFDFQGETRALADGIKAWPGTGLEDRHVNAYGRLARLLTRYAGIREQDKALQAMLREGYQPLQDALDAMDTVLRFFNKNHDNEQRIVLGMLEVEIPYSAAPRDRLLAALAKSHQQEKIAEYRLLGLRHTLAARHIEALRARHAALYRELDPAPAAASTVTLEGARP